jgi:hypothetical protein
VCKYETGFWGDTLGISLHETRFRFNIHDHFRVARINVQFYVIEFDVCEMFWACANFVADLLIFPQREFDDNIFNEALGSFN